MWETIESKISLSLEQKEQEKIVQNAAKFLGQTLILHNQVMKCWKNSRQETVNVESICKKSKVETLAEARGQMNEKKLKCFDEKLRLMTESQKEVLKISLSCLNWQRQTSNSIHELFNFKLRETPELPNLRAGVKRPKKKCLKK